MCKISKCSELISLWNSSALGLVLSVCLGQSGDLVKAWAADGGRTGAGWCWHFC